MKRMKDAATAGPAYGRASRLALAALMALLLAGAGCIFSPREPDGPPEGDETPWETPVTTTIVRSNLVAALEDENIGNISDCLTDDFRFHVDPSDSLDAGAEGEVRYANWTKEDEVSAHQAMFGDAVEIDISFANVEPPDESGDDTFRREDYVLTIVWSSGQGVNEEITYKGRATLHLRREQSRWAIYEWVDRRTVEPSENETWGVLRGDYRQ